VCARSLEIGVLYGTQKLTLKQTIKIILTTQLVQATKQFKTRTKRNDRRVDEAARTQQDILNVAAKEFSEKGLAGARVDEIAATTKTSKRMIYYYFGSKEGLYLATLEAKYKKVRDTENQLNLAHMAPEAALRCLVAVTFDHHLNNEDYIRMVMNENMNRAKYLKQSPQVQDLNRPAIQILTDIYERGVASGIFRAGLDPADIHASISALAFFNVSNRHTFGLIFQQDNHSPAYVAMRRENIVEMILRYVKA